MEFLQSVLFDRFYFHIEVYNIEVDIFKSKTPLSGTHFFCKYISADCFSTNSSTNIH